MDHVYLSLPTIRHLIFGFDEFFGERALSITVNEPECFRPRLVPRDIGRLLEEHDTTVPKTFHIIHFPSHSEVWSSKEWQLSASRRQQLIERANRNTEEYIRQQAEAQRYMALKEAVQAIIFEFMPKLRHPNEQINLVTLTQLLIKAPPLITDKFPGLTALINSYGNLPKGS